MPAARTDDRPDTRTAIVEAAARLLAEGGVRAVTTRAVAEAAGVQAPAIYRQFGDKDGLLDAVAEHVLARYVVDKARRTVEEASADPVADLRAGWRDHVGFALEHPDLYGLMSAPGRRSPATEAGDEVLAARIHRVAEAGMLRTDEARATAVVRAAGAGLIHVLLSTPPDERDPGLADAVLDAVCAAVVRDRPAVADDGDLAVAVAFGTVVPRLEALSPAERGVLAEWVGRGVDGLREGAERTRPVGPPRS